MALVYLDQFYWENTRSGETHNVRINYDDATYELSAVFTNVQTGVVMTNPPPTVRQFETDRPQNEGEEIVSLCVDGNGHRFEAIYNYPYATHTLEPNATYCIPQNGGCDLVVYDAIVTNETAQGANNGTALITFATSNNPAYFKLDEGVYDSQNPKTGIAPGIHTITVKDALGCLKTVSFKIGRYRQILVETPARNLSLNNVSRWTAVFNPANFKYQRKDYNVSYIRGMYDVFIIVYIDEVLTEEQLIAFAADKNIYVKTDKYEFTGPSSGVFYTDRPGETGIMVSAKFRGIDTSIGYLNALADKPGYRFVTEITYGFEDVKDIYLARHSPNLKGLTVADVSRYLKPEMQAKDEFLYNLRNWRDENLCASYSIRFKAEWEGGEDNWTAIEEPFYVTFSALQIGNPYGSNMAEYVPFAVEPNPLKKAKFMQEFKKPIFYSGMPFDLAFIYSEQMLGRQLYVRQTPLIGGQMIGGALDAFLLNEDTSFLLNEDTSRLLIERGSEAITGLLGVNRLILDNVYPIGTQEVGVYLYYLNGSTEVRVTEILTLQFKASPDCGDYRYIKWLNPLGGWSYAMFEFRVDHGLEVSETEIIDRFIEDYATADASNDVISREAVRKETVGRSAVPAEDIKVLSSMYYSVKAYLLVNTNPRKWMTIIIEPRNGNLYNSKDGAGDFELTYKMPVLNLQHQ